jgi:hypothetical protein
LLSRFHRVDQHLVAAVKDEDDEFEQSSVGVKAEPELGYRSVLLLWRCKDPVLCHVDGVVWVDVMGERRVVDQHYAAWVQARTASRIASDRLTPSCFARSVSASSRSVSIRTGALA